MAYSDDSAARSSLGVPYTPLKHGHNRGGQRTKEYRTWSHIIDRCRNPSNDHYANYGGRGIGICEAWADSFEAFLTGVGLAPTPQHTIDRIDNDKGYEPGNCRWATRAEQLRNNRRTILVEGECLKDTCARRGLSYGAVQERIRRGHPLAHALSPLTGGAYRAMRARSEP